MEVAFVDGGWRGHLWMEGASFVGGGGILHLASCRAMSRCSSKARMRCINSSVCSWWLRCSSCSKEKDRCLGCVRWIGGDRWGARDGWL